MKKILLGVVMVSLAGCATMPTSSCYLKTVRSESAKKINTYSVSVIIGNRAQSDLDPLLVRSLITELVNLDFIVIERSQIGSVLDQSYSDFRTYIGLGKEECSLLKTRTAPGVEISDSIKQTVRDNYYMMDLFDRVSIKDTGKSIGADALMIINTVAKEKRFSVIHIRLIEVDTSRVLLSSTFYNDPYDPVGTLSFVSRFGKQLRQIIDGKKSVSGEDDEEVQTISNHRRGR